MEGKELCLDCGKMISSKNVKKHRANVHVLESVKCTDCDKTSYKQLGTPQQGKKQHSMLIHLNSMNI